jgi:hypothetical protein
LDKPVYMKILSIAAGGQKFDRNERREIGYG